MVSHILITLLNLSIQKARQRSILTHQLLPQNLRLGWHQKLNENLLPPLHPQVPKLNKHFIQSRAWDWFISWFFLESQKFVSHNKPKEQADSMPYQAIPPFFPPQVYQHQQLGDSFKRLPLPVAYVAKLDNEGIGCCCWTPVFSTVRMEIARCRNQSEGQINMVFYATNVHLYICIMHQLAHRERERERDLNLKPWFVMIFRRSFAWRDKILIQKKWRKNKKINKAPTFSQKTKLRPNLATFQASKNLSAKFWFGTLSGYNYLGGWALRYRK